MSFSRELSETLKETALCLCGAVAAIGLFAFALYMYSTGSYWVKILVLEIPFLLMILRALVFRDLSPLPLLLTLAILVLFGFCLSSWLENTDIESAGTKHPVALHPHPHPDCNDDSPSRQKGIRK